MSRITVSFLLAIALVACSGGGSPTATSGTTVRILTESLDQGNVEHAFLQRLEATGGVRPYSWWISASGEELPEGLTLGLDGLLSGFPTESASRTVLVVVQDARSELDIVSFSIEIRDVEISGASATVLTPGTQVQFSASGGVASYTFSFAANRSGAALTSTGTYTAGSDSGVDVIRATDRDGFYDEVSLTVGDDPFAGFAADWGTTDVWWINFDTVYDPTPIYATDLDEVLVTLGLRHPDSVDAAGTEADQLARQLFLRRVLGWLSHYYGNGMDGHPQPGGLSISFTGPSGPGAGTLPGVGGILLAGPGRYSSICIRHGSDSGVVGTAWLDNGNRNVEHDCGDPNDTSLGVFPNRILGPYLASFRNAINGDPVGPSDVDGLRAMLFGAAPSNARERDIFEVADEFARVTAAVLAHEIGHSLGLLHSSPSAGPGDLMNASLNVGPSVSYAFNTEHLSLLLTNLPGPNR